MGILTTDDPGFDRRFRLWRQHSMSVPDTVRHGNKEVIFESSGPGLQLPHDRYPGGDRSSAAETCSRDRTPAPGTGPTLPRTAWRPCWVRFSGGAEWARTNWQSYCVRLPEDRPQKPVMQALLDRGIATRRGVMCAHREAAYPSGTWLCQRRGACACAPHHCEELQHSEQAQIHSSYCRSILRCPMTTRIASWRPSARFSSTRTTWWKTST